MAHYEGLEAITRIKVLAKQRRLVGALYNLEGEVPIRALISSVEVVGNTLVLHSRSFFHLRHEDNVWCEESAGDINATVTLDDCFVLEDWMDGYFLAYPPERVRIELTY